MFTLFSGLSTYLTHRQSTVIDNNIFKLHYIYTFVILVACSIVVTAFQHFGNPIYCHSEGSKIETKLLNGYCWTRSTFSVVSAWNKKIGTAEEGGLIPYPGIDNSRKSKNEKLVYHSYYQWVGFVLFIQAVMFYIPRYIWKTYEDNHIKNIILGLDQPICPEDVKKSNRAILVRYLADSLNNNNLLFRTYVLTECLNLINVCIQMKLMDNFLSGQFSTYGWKALTLSNWDGEIRDDPMIRVFPRITKCIFYLFGSSGDVEKKDALCLLPINIVNEKIYIFLWFWFYLLFIITVIGLTYRTVLICVPRSRYLSLKTRCLTNHDSLYALCKRLSIGDWFVLTMLSKNLDRINFRDVVVELSDNLYQKA
ncbi:innexin inx2-like [Oppia nitens]|uniref:innexin inx2-like n=1 Tax=Oppia nitens TaxID=1686743 RepID=UPI0023DB46F1|nr:innexin inx2-like [Oppia nitens]